MAGLPSRGRRGRSSSCSQPRSARTSPASCSCGVAALALRLALLVAVAVQALPLASPLVLSTDAWTYWSYGWIAAEGGGNPYVDPPAAFPQSPAAGHAGADWRDTTSVYGPAFTLASEPVARLAGSSSDAAAWIFKGLAAVCVLAATAAVARTFAPARPGSGLRGLEPGHRDPRRRWRAQRRARGRAGRGAVALGAHRRASLGGSAWALATFVKWIPLVFFALSALAARARGRRAEVVGFAVAAAVAAAVATVRYGVDWLSALGPLTDNAARRTSYALPSRLEELGLPHGVALGVAVVLLAGGLAWLALEAHRGRARLGRTACLVLATTPYLVVWYLAWAVPLAAPEDDDRVARLGALALTAYLLPQTIPL